MFAIGFKGLELEKSAKYKLCGHVFENVIA